MRGRDLIWPSLVEPAVAKLRMIASSHNLQWTLQTSLGGAGRTPPAAMHPRSESEIYTLSQSHGLHGLSHAPNSRPTDMRILSFRATVRAPPVTGASAIPRRRPFVPKYELGCSSTATVPVSHHGPQPELLPVARMDLSNWADHVLQTRDRNATKPA